MYVGKLFDKIEVNFPIEGKLKLIHGPNGSYKSYTLSLLADYFKKQGENVLYFPTYRYLTITPQEIESIMLMQHLSNPDNVFKRYGIEYKMIEKDLEIYYKNPIQSGFIQIINLFCNILKQKEDVIVLIDIPEVSLHLSIRRRLVEDLLELSNVKKLFIVTHSPEIVSGHRNDMVDIEECIKFL